MKYTVSNLSKTVTITTAGHIDRAETLAEELSAVRVEWFDVLDADKAVVCSYNCGFRV